MQKLEQLQRKVKNAEDLQSIVRTMKVMASVGIHQFEDAADSLGDYYDTLERGLQVVLSREFSEARPFLSSDDEGSAGIIVIGSSQSLCGPFDESILTYTLEKIREDKKRDTQFFVLGERLTGYLHQAGVSVDKQFILPGSAGGIGGLVLDLLAGIEEWQATQDIRSIRVLHNKPADKEGYTSHSQHLLPLNKRWLERLVDRPWPTNNLPQYRADAHTLFLSLLRQYLFVSLYRAVAESLVAEYTSRLSAMQQAEKKIDERLEKLNRAYTHERQSAITSELLDIMAGFEAAQSMDENNQ
ncbi:F-type H+-transporting ATPase subunit gamma [Fodinibius roseus]|uniref:F-type H+-transporting ATPase subunit gamma n=1 Tax=Fodinibius roseus TaxID=1194090 RepID=A0A1M4X872_9BACT|nr:F0F1 ATP synthase subunit gamma [Fodinibius roseus]SHE89623.1 F-type H+-transporting ATPase subunit gamma [Fodinibius roseus]